MPVGKCSSCGKELTDEEKERYYTELDDWMERHPDWMTYIDDRMIHSSSVITGVYHDCDGCAVRRLRSEKEMKAREPFLARAARGGSEGWWLIAVGVLLLAVLLISGREEPRPPSGATTTSPMKNARDNEGCRLMRTSANLSCPMNRPPRYW